MSNFIRKLTLMIIFSCVLLLGYVYLLRDEDQKTLAQDLTSSLPIVKPQPSPTPKRNISQVSLARVVQDSLKGAPGNYAIYIKNLKTNEMYFEEDRKSYDTASLYKLWVMGTVFKKIESGELTGDQVLSQSVATLNNEFGISPADAELTSGGVTFSVDEALTKMITISHNYAALLLTEQVKLSAIADYLQQNGFKDSKVGTDGSNPSTNAHDVAMFLEKLYKGQLGNKDSTEKMLNLLKAQQLNNKLPKYMPKDVVIAHKTGELGTFTHDAGIVYTPKGDYIIVILSEADTPSDAEDEIGQLSEAVYEYFTK
jgi:beta-lactamase class A